MLAVVLSVLLIVMAGDRQVSRQRARRMRRIAERCGFRYSSVDRFDLARRVRGNLPLWARDITVRDLMYRSADGGYVYAFTAVYAGEDRGHVVLLARETCGDCELHDVQRGDETLPLGEQYRRLLHEAIPSSDPLYHVPTRES